MYPTKIFDGEERQEEHVLRHLEVLNAAYDDPTISGSIGWCMADYNTHADFGSGDRICYHGVMTMGRAPKFAAHAYASQGFSADEKPILEPATHWAFGDRKVGGIFPLVILTNCDEISFERPGTKPMRFTPDWSRFHSLPNAPVVIENTDIPDEDRLDWGDRWLDGKIVGYVRGKPVIERSYVAAPAPTTLDVDVAPLIRKDDAYHDRLVRFTVRDQVGNRLPYCMDQLRMEASEPLAVNGPNLIPIVGGVGSVWVRQPQGRAGTLSATLVSGSLASVTVAIDD